MSTRAFLVVESGFNPRDYIGDEEDQEFKNDIAANGVHDPLIVQKNGRAPLSSGKDTVGIGACLEAIAEGHEMKPVPIILTDRNISESNAFVLGVKL